LKSATESLGELEHTMNLDVEKSHTLSVCITTQNCAHKLVNAIKSVVSIADEIVVVDGGSSDNTKEVACSFEKVRYYCNNWPESHALQKNYAMDQATGTWILLLDSDETVGANMRKHVGRLIRSQRHDCYIFPRYWIAQTNPLQHVRSKKLYPDYQQRLFRNSPLYRYTAERKIHIKFPDEIQGEGKKVKDTHIFHFDLVYSDRAAREEKAKERELIEPETVHINRNQYLFEDAPYPYKIMKCREEL
jgi:glycosyltransferase involved in cell wall biosynthesis